jgi:hypothetical protein
LAGILMFAAAPLAAQNVVSARAGMIHYVEGRATVDGKPVKVGRYEFPEVKENQTLKTAAGRAEILLAPGAILRVGENSAIHMIEPAITDTRVELRAGSALVEIMDLPKGNQIRIHLAGAESLLKKPGLYRFDAEPAQLRVFDGAVEIARGEAKPLKAGRGKLVALEDSLVATRFDTKKGDSLHRWAARRSGYLAVANLSAARMAQSSQWGFQSTGWMWNPYFGMFTYVPGSRIVMSPWGYAYYSPRTVDQAFMPPVPSSAPSTPDSGFGRPVYRPDLGYSTVQGRGGPVSMGPAPGGGGGGEAAPAAGARGGADAGVSRGGDGGGRGR